MDFWSGLALFILIVVIMTCCGCCCTSKKRGEVLATPAVITSTVTAAPGGYPVTVMPLPPGSYQATVHSAPPYPTQMPPTAHVAMPMPIPVPANQAPMPGFQTMPPYQQMARLGLTGPSAGHLNMNPPTYDMAVGQPSANFLYEKQAPYNPNFVAH